MKEPINNQPLNYNAPTNVKKYQRMSNAINDSKTELYKQSSIPQKNPSLSISTISHTSNIRPQSKIPYPQTRTQTLSESFNIQNPSNSKTSRQVLNEFKELLKQTDYITTQINSMEAVEPNTILCGNLFQNKNNMNINTNNKIKNRLFYETGQGKVNVDDSEDSDMIDKDVDELHEKKNLDITNSQDTDSSINLDDITNDIQTFYEENNKVNHNYGIDYQNQKNQAILLQKEINKLKLSNQVLTRSNLDLRNNNKILELEINSYKTNTRLSNLTNSFGKNMPSTEYDNNLANFIQNSKTSLIDSINGNLYLIDQINTIQNQNKKLFEENLALVQNYNERIKEIENCNRKNAEIQITNEENEKAYEEIEKNNKILRETLGKLQLELAELESKENNLNLINESNMKTKNDNEELLFQLKTTYERLTKSSNENSIQINNSQNQINEANYVINNKKKEIIDLIEIIKGLSEELEVLKKENIEISQKIEEKAEIEENLKQKESEVQKEYDYANQENENAKKDNVEKDNVINFLKDNISKTINLEDSQVNTRENELDEEIRAAEAEREKKQRELEEVKLRYEDIIKRKDQMIQEMLANQDNNDEIEEENEAHDDGQDQQNNNPPLSNENPFTLNKENMKRVEIDDLEDINDDNI